jgi:hypothetical protein
MDSSRTIKTDEDLFSDWGIMIGGRAVFSIQAWLSPIIRAFSHLWFWNSKTR